LFDWGKGYQLCGGGGGEGWGGGEYGREPNADEGPGEEKGPFIPRNVGGEKPEERGKGACSEKVRRLKEPSALRWEYKREKEGTRIRTGLGRMRGVRSSFSKEIHKRRTKGK